MRSIILAFGLIVVMGCQGQNQNKKTMETAQKEKVMKAENIYQFKVKDIEGNDFDFATLKGKKMMIVNTASECGLTPQYEQLQKVYSEFKDKNFVIVGFPAE